MYALRTRLVKLVARSLVLFALLALASGCAVFRGDQLAPIGQMDPPTVEKPLPVSFEYSWSRNGQPYTVGGNNKFLQEQEAEAKRIIVESGLFEVVDDASVPLKPDHILKYNVDNHGNVVLAALSGFISGFTFMVVPGGATDHWTLTAELIDRSGVAQWTQSYDDRMTTVTWLPMIPFMFSANHRVPDVSNSILANMYKYPVRDLNRADLLTPISALSPTTTTERD